MQVKLKYGRDGLAVDLPETPGFIGVLAARTASPLGDAAAAVREALGAPVDSPALSELARGRRSACVVISDITRPVPNGLLLPSVLEAIEAGGVPREAIVILVATGLHRPNLGAELERLVGPGIVGTYRVENHDARGQDLVHVGDLPDGTPLLVNPIYVRSELKVLTGFIEPHMWAGYSGGRKSILPGIASARTMRYLHGPAIVAHPRVEYGVLEGNPFHEAALAAMASAGADFVLNVTLDARGAVTGVFAGEPVGAHRRGCAFLETLCVRTLDEPLDFVVTTNAGAPLDCNLYQTTKGITAAATAVKPGGVVLIASACFEGVGSPDFQRAMDLIDTPQGFLDRLMAGEFFFPDQWCAQEICQVLVGHPVWLHTDGIPAATLERYALRGVASVGDAVRELLGRFGRSARWAVVPDGPMVILRAAGA